MTIDLFWGPLTLFWLGKSNESPTASRFGVHVNHSTVNWQQESSHHNGLQPGLCKFTRKNCFLSGCIGLKRTFPKSGHGKCLKVNWLCTTHNIYRFNSYNGRFRFAGPNLTSKMPNDWAWNHLKHLTRQANWHVQWQYSITTSVHGCSFWDGCEFLIMRKFHSSPLSTTDFPGCPDMMQFVDCHRHTEERCVKDHLSTMKEDHLYSDGAWSEWCLTWTLIIPTHMVNPKFLGILLPNVLDTTQLISTQQFYKYHYTQTLCETTDCNDFRDGWIMSTPTATGM